MQRPNIVRVSISEAARLFGVNPQTIRRAIKEEELAYIVVAGRYKINFESLVKWSQRKTTVENKLNKNGIGQYVDKWKIRNTLYSPSVKQVPGS
jgi:excisionase family DNA binding protein